MTPFTTPVRYDEIQQAIIDARNRTVAIIGFARDLAERIKAKERGLWLVDVINNNGVLPTVAQVFKAQEMPSEPKKRGNPAWIKNGSPK